MEYPFAQRELVALLLKFFLLPEYFHFAIMIAFFKLCNCAEDCGVDVSICEQV